jgi:hypothetical protein
MKTAYKLGWKTSYYQNTYDFKGEEEEVQPAGLSAVVDEDEGEDVILEPQENVNGTVNGHGKVSTTADEDGECEACTI